MHPTALQALSSAAPFRLTGLPSDLAGLEKHILAVAAERQDEVGVELLEIIDPEELVQAWLDPDRDRKPGDILHGLLFTAAQRVARRALTEQRAREDDERAQERAFIDGIYAPADVRAADAAGMRRFGPR